MNKKAHLAALIFASIFGFSFLFSKIALSYLSPLGLIAYRFLFAYLGFELLRIFRLIKININRSNIAYGLLTAFFQPLLYFLFETYGLAKTSSGEAGMMIALIPIIVSLLSAFILKEKPKKAQYLFIALSVSGIIFIQLMKPNQGGSNITGIILLFLAVLSAGFYNIASRNASKKLSPIETTYLMMLTGAAVFNVIYLTELIIGKNVSSYFALLTEGKVIIPLLYLGLVASIGGFFMMNYALSHLPAHVSSIYSNLSTIVAIIAGALFLQESLTWFHYVGSAMIIVGVYGTVALQKIRQKKEVSL